KPKKATDPTMFASRLASASLLGKDVEPLSSGTPFASGQFTKTDGSSKVDLFTGVGPVDAVIQVLTDIDPTRNSLDTLVVQSKINLKGELDLRPASQGFALILGKWHMGE